MVLVVAIILSTLAQRPSDVVRWTAVGPATSIKAGETTTIKITADIEPGWQLYALTQLEGGPRPLEIKSPRQSPFSVVASRIKAPLPKVAKTSGDPPVVDPQFYDETTTFDVPVAIPVTTQAGKASVPIEITFQACDGRLCLRPATETVSADVIVSSRAGKDRE